MSQKQKGGQGQGQPPPPPPHPPGAVGPKQQPKCHHHHRHKHRHHHHRHHHIHKHRHQSQSSPGGIASWFDWLIPGSSHSSTESSSSTDSSDSDSGSATRLPRHGSDEERDRIRSHSDNSGVIFQSHCDRQTHRRKHADKLQHHGDQRKNVPIEASITNYENDDDAQVHPPSHHSHDHDPQIFCEELLQEFSSANLAAIAGTPSDPERFLLPTNGAGAHGSGHYLERNVNASKLLDCIVDYMEHYFDIGTDLNPISVHREKLDETLWDHIAYVIPVACRQLVDDSLRDEPPVVTTSPNVVVFGDIHGNLSDIYYIYKHYISNQEYSQFKFVFLGDYVDRGPRSVEVCTFLIICKLIDPNRFILLRGNHEVSKVNTKYGFRCLVDTLYKYTFLKTKGLLPRLIYDSFRRLFCYLPVAAVIRYKDKKGVFCCHGGIPNEEYNGNSVWKIEEINQLGGQIKPHSLVPKKNCPPGQSMLNEILWNDPIPKPIYEKLSKSQGQKLFYQNRKRGGHCSWYTEQAVERFLEANHLAMVIRGHQYGITSKQGYCFNMDGQKVVTVFSSSNYCGIEHNVTGCVLVTEESIQPKVLRTIEESCHYRQFNGFELLTDKSNKVVGVVY